MKKQKVSMLWFLLCTFVFVISTFIHECGHGISSALAGQPVSTGFNRVGNIFMFPKESGFRTGLNLDANSLIDLGVPITLLIAIAFTVLYYKRNFASSRTESVVITIALCNSLIRLIPSLAILIVPILTGNLHIEDELQTGLQIQKVLGINGIQYFPALISIIISILCLLFIFRKAKAIHRDLNLRLYSSLLMIAYVASFLIDNLLDNLFRINWIL